LKVHPKKDVLSNNKLLLMMENEFKQVLNLKSIYKLSKVTGDDYGKLFLKSCKKME